MCACGDTPQIGGCHKPDSRSALLLDFRVVGLTGRTSEQRQDRTTGISYAGARTGIPNSLDPLD